MFKMTKAQRAKLSHTGPALVVFGVAAWQSYWHTVEVAMAHGESMSAYVMPLSVDGLMIVAARYITHARTRTGRYAALSGFVLGACATFAANLAAADPTVFARCVAAWPALAMTLTAVIMHWGERPVKARPRIRTTRSNVTPIVRKKSA